MANSCPLKMAGFQAPITGWVWAPLDIIRPGLVEWLRAVRRDRLAEIVENTLAAGHVVLALLQASAGEESMGRFFRPVVSKMEELKCTIDGLLRATQKSRGLGQIG